MSANPKQWLTVKEAAEHIGVKVSTLYANIGSRRIPHHKLPGSSLVRFNASELDDWIVSGKVETEDEYHSRTGLRKE